MLGVDAVCSVGRMWIQCVMWGSVSVGMCECVDAMCSMCRVCEQFECGMCGMWIQCIVCVNVCGVWM